MVPEVVQRWDRAIDFIAELIATDNDLREARRYISDMHPLPEEEDYPADAHSFHLVDANGNTVAFPLTLLATTEFKPRTQTE